MSKLTAVLFVMSMLGSPAATAQTPNLGELGPTIGSRAADFSAADQFGRTQTLQSVMGRDGLMLVFYRSADW